MTQRMSSAQAAVFTCHGTGPAAQAGSLVVFDNATAEIDYAALLDRVQRSMPSLAHHRQRSCRVPANLADPVWVDDPDFELGYHVRRCVLPRPGTDGQLLEFCGRIWARPLNPARPLWELYLVEGLRDRHRSASATGRATLGLGATATVTGTRSRTGPGASIGAGADVGPDVGAGWAADGGLRGQADRDAMIRPVALVTKTHMALLEDCDELALLRCVLASPALPADEVQRWQPPLLPSSATLVYQAVRAAAVSPADFGRAVTGVAGQLTRMAGMGQLTGVIGEGRDLVGKELSGLGNVAQRGLRPGLFGRDGAGLRGASPPAAQHRSGAGPVGSRAIASRQLCIARTSMAVHQRISSSARVDSVDTVLGVVTGALRYWLMAQLVPVATGASIDALVAPVPQRGPAAWPVPSGDWLDAGPIATRASTDRVALPVSEPDPAQRLLLVRDRDAGCRPPRSPDGERRDGRGTQRALGSNATRGGAMSSVARRLLRTGARTAPVVVHPVRDARLQACADVLASAATFAPLQFGESLAIVPLVEEEQMVYGLLGDSASMPCLPLLAELFEQSLVELQRASGRVLQLRPGVARGAHSLDATTGSVDPEATGGGVRR